MSEPTPTNSSPSGPQLTVNEQQHLTAQELHQQALAKAKDVKQPAQIPTHPQRSAIDAYIDRNLSESGAEDLALILAEESAAETALAEALKENEGFYNSPTVLGAAIRVLESWIQLYKLQPMDELIEKIEPFCKEQDDNDVLYIKCVQMKAFLRYKQRHFEEALGLFLILKGSLGATPELLENMGHTYNVCGQDVEAVKCFKEAIQLQTTKIAQTRAVIQSKMKEDIEDQAKVREEHGLPPFTEEEINDQQALQTQLEELAVESITLSMGGLLLGVGTSLKKQGNIKEAIVYLEQALTLYKKRFNGQDHSLIAKTLTGLADACEKMDNYSAAAEAHKEAVRIFKLTCGVSPLTANALQNQGNCFAHLANAVLAGVTKDNLETLSQAKRQELVVKNWFFTVEAVVAYDEAFELHCGFDTPDCNQIIRLIQAILNNKTQLLQQPFPTPTSPPLELKPAMVGYIPHINKCMETINSLGLSQTDEAAVLNKSFGEVLLLAGELTDGLAMLKSAKAYFEQVKHFDCSGLIETVNGLIAVAIQVAGRDGIELTDNNQ